MSKELRVAILGGGKMAQKHGTAIRLQPGARFVVNNNARLEMGHQAVAANHSIAMGEVVVNNGGILEVGFEENNGTVQGHQVHSLTVTAAGGRNGGLTLNEGATLILAGDRRTIANLKQLLVQGKVN